MVDGGLKAQNGLNHINPFDKKQKALAV